MEVKEDPIKEDETLEKMLNEINQHDGRENTSNIPDQKCLTCEKSFSQFELQIHYLSCNDFKKPAKEIDNIVKREELEANDDKVESELLNYNKPIHKGKSNRYTVIQDPINGKLFKCLKCVKILKSRAVIKTHYNREHREKKHKCEKCSKLFAYPAELKIHSKSHLKEKEPVKVKKEIKEEKKCDSCGKSFDSQRKFKTHLSACLFGIEGEFKCKTCDKKFDSFRLLRRHTQNSHLEVKCEICENIFANFRNLENHVNSHHREILEKCKICDKKFSNLKYLNDHTRISHTTTQNNVKCEKCNKFFKSETALNSHIDVIHKGIKNYKCKFCLKPFGHRFSLNKHVRLFHKSRQILCYICKKCFSNLNSLEEHLTNVHVRNEETSKSCNIANVKSLVEEIIQKVVNISEKLYKCAYCHKLFPSKSEIVRHKRIHYKKKCDFCNKKFKDASKLEAHKSIHLKPAACDLCEDTFSSLFLLIGHVSKHQSDHKIKQEKNQTEIKYECDICKEPIEGSLNLPNHMTIHKKGLNGYDCHICQRHVNRRQELQQHLRNFHNSENKPWLCEYCNEVFQEKIKLNRHLNEHHSKEMKTCKKCGHTFTKYDKLKIHLKNQSCHSKYKRKNKNITSDINSTNENLKQCDTCGKSFSSMFYVRKHKKIAHNDTKEVLCKSCGKYFSSETTMKFHYSLVHKEKDLVCDLCGKTFALQFQLKKHVNDFHNRANKCELCDIILSNKQSLGNHMKRIHGGLKAIVSKVMCEFCGIEYASKENLSMHITVNHSELSGSKVKCEMCNKVVEAVRLKWHNQRHHNAKNSQCIKFMCEFCGKEYISKESLTSHISAHHSELSDTKVQCKLCDKVVGAAHLKRHTKRHHIGTDFQCSKCGKNMASKAGLRVHNTRNHLGEC